MAEWRYTINLNSLIQQLNEQFDLERVEEDAPEEVKQALASEVSKAPPLVKFATHLRKSKSIAEMNRVLTQIFDAADKTKVWCGF